MYYSVKLNYTHMYTYKIQTVFQAFHINRIITYIHMIGFASYHIFEPSLVLKIKSSGHHQIASTNIHTGFIEHLFCMYICMYNTIFMYMQITFEYKTSYRKNIIIDVQQILYIQDTSTSTLNHPFKWSVYEYTCTYIP